MLGSDKMPVEDKSRHREMFVLVTIEMNNHSKISLRKVYSF